MQQWWRERLARWGLTTAFRRDLTAAGALALVGLARVPVNWVAAGGRVLWRANAAATVELLALGWRRRAPVPVLAVATGAVLATGFAPVRYPLGGVGLFACAYAVGSELPPRRAAATLTAGAVAHAAGGIALGRSGRSLSLMLSFWDVSSGDVRNVVIASLATYGLPGLCGAFVQTQRAYSAELVARAERLETERDDEARRAVLEERGRIARELHDVAAHDLSAIVVQAGAADRLLDDDPAGARAVLVAIRHQGRATLTALRGLVGVVRGDDSDGRAPQPGLADIDRLVAAARTAGSAITLEVSGSPAACGQTVELAAFRVLQEALTNARRHAPGAGVHVTVAHTPDALRVEVVDEGVSRPSDQPATGHPPADRDGHAPDAGRAQGPADGTAQAGHPPPDRDGHGLTGMRERVQQAGGTIVVGPADGGGWRVEARFPAEA